MPETDNFGREWTCESDENREDMMPKLDARAWGRYKSNLLRIINMVPHIIQEDIMEDSIKEARQLLQQLNAKYQALILALEVDSSGDYEEELDVVQQCYANTRVTIK